MFRLFMIAAATLLATPSNAADLKVVLAGAVRGVLGTMIQDYSRESGNKFEFVIGPTGTLREAIASGKPADLVVVSGPLMAELEKSGKVIPGSRVELGRMGLGIVIREGAPVPDVSTPEAFKQTLLNAKTIAHTDPKMGGTSIIQLMKIGDALGIREILVQKAVPANGGADAVVKVAEGKAEIGFVLVSELLSKGVILAGLVPEPHQLWTVYSAAIPASSTQPEHARALVAALTKPELRPRWIAAGWEPMQ
jgi:molybdate transport system substrate-binding protein